MTENNLKESLDKLDQMHRKTIRGKKSTKNQEYLDEAFDVVTQYFGSIKTKRLKSRLLDYVHVRGFEKIVPFLLKEFQKAPKELEDVWWRIGNALEVIRPSREEDIKEMMNLALGKKYGRNREMLVLALGKSKNNIAIPVLIQLLDDEDVSGHALLALREYLHNQPELLNYFKPFLNHEETWIRNIAKKAIR